MPCGFEYHHSASRNAEFLEGFYHVLNDLQRFNRSKTYHSASRHNNLEFKTDAVGGMIAEEPRDGIGFTHFTYAHYIGGRCMLIKIDCRRMLGGRVAPIYVDSNYIAFIDEETVTVGLSTGKVIDTTTKSCMELVRMLCREETSTEKS